MSDVAFAKTDEAIISRVSYLKSVDKKYKQSGGKNAKNDRLDDDGSMGPRKLYADDEKERYIHVYHSVARAAAERLELERELNKMAEALDKTKNIKYDFPLSYHHYFDLIFSKDGKLMTYTENSKAVEEELSYCGYFCIVTSEKMTAKEALAIYKSRDENEKLFRADKSFLGNGSMRVHSEESTD